MEQSESSTDLGKMPHQVDSGSKGEVDDDDLNEFDIPAEKNNGEINHGRLMNNQGIQRLLRGPEGSASYVGNTPLQPLRNV